MGSPLVTAPVVVGVDGSRVSLAALDWAADEAARHGRPLRVVHASLWERYEGVEPAGSAHRPSGQVLAETVVASAADRARLRSPAVTVTADVLAEDPASALLREGREAALLVVGSRGRGAFADLLLGSVGFVVAARSTGPVVVVRGDPYALEGRHGRVLLGIGEHDVDSPAVRFAFREAAVRGAELDVVRVWRRRGHEAAGHPLLTGEGGAQAEHEASDLLDKTLDAAAGEHPDVRLRRTTAEGHAHRVLTERSAAADLLVVGARRRDGLVGLELGRVAHRALHHAACPVAVVPQRRPGPPEEAP
ncbi:universal stress protein [Streptomyces sp. SKN60]|uniref:universal stress protein n=1 Tax=Streptomyces sp. SKN60 TaxID=2855506 RepID=UPI002248633E|nr:universal stress protein [Streptomyces sp. SKN60]MCX2181421.1 universal stress protein [Streptomyces sp. SKN60]